MPHLHDEDKAGNDDDASHASACSKSIETTAGDRNHAVCPATESAANKLLSLAAMAEEHAKSSLIAIKAKPPQETEEEEDTAIAAGGAPHEAALPPQDEMEPPPQLVEGHPPSPSIAHLVARHPPYVDEAGRQQLPPPSPGMGGPRSWGAVVGHHPHPRFHGFVRPGVMHRVYPGPPPPGPMAGSPVPMGEHPVRYMRRGAPARGGFPMWTASPRPPYHPPPSPLPPAFRSASMTAQPYTMTRQCSSNDDDSSSVNSGRAPAMKRAASGSYPTKSILKKVRVDTPTTPAAENPPTSEEDAAKEVGAEQYTLSKTVSASTDAGVDSPDTEVPMKTTIESIVVEKSSFSSEDVIVKRQRIISPASSNEYQKSEHDEEFVYTQEGTLSPDQRGRMMSHEAAAVAAAAGSPGPHYRLVPPFHMGHPPPPVQGMHCGPPRRGPAGHYMPPGPMYSHHGMRPFPPPMGMPAVTGPPGMYPPRNMSSRGRPAYAGMPPFYAARPRMEASPSPSSVTPEQPRPKHMIDKAPQPPVPTSSATGAISRRQSGTPTSVGGLDIGEASGSANRCIPLTPPVPSKYWSDADITKDIILPDFHRLVNFPDLLVKGRNVAGEGGDSGSPNALSGKKRCVMCGQLRVSATYVRAKKASADESADSSSTSAGMANQGGSSHIIPRQNKGVCTACDVTVWVALELDGLEIKWCKGCKNFRPWSHFGDKSLATKCLRCRDRQKEKYALQKSASRRRSSTSSVEEKKTDDHPCSLAVVAANGLRDLMNATR